MSAMRTVGVLVGVVLVAGAASGGVVTNPDGSINGQATIQKSAELGGQQLGASIDRTGEAVGRGAGSAVGSSGLLKAGAIGAAAYGAAKYGPKVKTRYSSCWQRKSCDGSPIEQPEKPAGMELEPAPQVPVHLGPTLQIG